MKYWAVINFVTVHLAHGRVEIVAARECRDKSLGVIGGSIFTQDGFQSLDDQIFDGSATSNFGDLGAFQKAVGDINGRFHRAIDTRI